jgi:hypothetical protein
MRTPGFHIDYRQVGGVQAVSVAGTGYWIPR